MAHRSEHNRLRTGSPRTRSLSRSVSTPRKLPQKSHLASSSSRRPSPILPPSSQLASSDSSSDSDDDDDDPSHSNIFVLHRHLQLRALSRLLRLDDQFSSDLFTAAHWRLDHDDLKPFADLNDTSLVQIHHPVPLGPPQSTRSTLRDIAPPAAPLASTSRIVDSASSLPTQTQSLPNHGLPRVSAASHAGPSVPSLYYSPYSSFAPCYDTASTSQTAEHARIEYLSRQRLTAWGQRHDRLVSDIEPLGDLLAFDRPPDIPSRPQEPEARRTKRGKKRQKVKATESSGSSTTLVPAAPNQKTPQEIHQAVRCALDKNSQLIRNLQERQFDRLRAAHDSHLDPSLSAPTASAGPSPALQDRLASSAIQPGPDELRESSLLMNSLCRLMSYRPRSRLQPDDEGTPAGPARDDRGASEIGLIPSVPAIRRSFAMMIEPWDCPGDDSESVYDGDLPPANAFAVEETVLNSEPNPRLAQFLLQPRLSSDDHPTRSASALNSVPPGRRQQSYSASYSTRDPNLSSPWTPSVSKYPQNLDQARPKSASSSHPTNSKFSQPNPSLSSLQKQKYAASPFKSKPSLAEAVPLSHKMSGAPPAGLSNHPNHRALASNVNMISTPLNSTRRIPR